MIYLILNVNYYMLRNNYQCRIVRLCIGNYILSTYNYTYIITFWKMEFTTYTNLRKNLASSLDFVSKNKVPLIITRGNKKPIVMIDIDEYNSWKETEYLNSTEANRKALNESISNVKNRKNLTKINIEELQCLK